MRGLLLMGVRPPFLPGLLASDPRVPATDIRALLKVSRLGLPRIGPDGIKQEMTFEYY